MYNDFVTPDIAILLKEINFNEPCWLVYLDINDLNKDSKPVIWGVKSDDIFRNSFNKHTASAPTWTQIFRWFRETINADSYIKKSIDGGYRYSWWNGEEWINNYDDSYDEAQDSCLHDLIVFYKNYMKNNPQD